MISKSQLEIIVSKLDKFKNPNEKLEQYPTDSEIASTILWHAYMKGRIKDKVIIDMGCGTGVLGIGALLLGAKKVYFMDIDKKVLEILNENLKKTEKEYNLKLMNKIQFINKDIKEITKTDFSDKIDLVIQNPPFGTREKHIDIIFLEKAMHLAEKIYSFHKSSTERFIEKIISENHFNTEEILRFGFPLKQTLKHHKRKIHRIEVSCFILFKTRTDNSNIYK